MSPSRTTIVVADRLPTGLAANAAAVLAVTIGARVPELVGADLVDADERVHPGIVRDPVPILRTSVEQLGVLRDGAESAGLLAVPFTSLAQSCRTYDEYSERLSSSPGSELEIIALALHGPTKAVTRLVGALPLLR